MTLLATPTAKLLGATAAGLGALLVTAHIAPDAAEPTPVATQAPAPAASAAASAAAAAPRPAASGSADAAWSLDQRERSIPQADGDAFARLNWQRPPPPPPPPPPPAPVVVAAPVAPPLPFTYLGLFEQAAGKPQAFLARGEALLVVAAGDVIDNNTYRVDTLSGSTIVLTFLPLGKQQTLSVSGGPK